MTTAFRSSRGRSTSSSSRRCRGGRRTATASRPSSSGALGLDDSALYHALARLEGRGLVTAEWGVTENNRRARYYQLTARGREHLRAEAATWTRYAKMVAG